METGTVRRRIDEQPLKECPRLWDFIPIRGTLVLCAVLDGRELVQDVEEERRAPENRFFARGVGKGASGSTSR
jgi:hypothetical protein